MTTQPLGERHGVPIFTDLCTGSTYPFTSCLHSTIDVRLDKELKSHDVK